MSDEITPGDLAVARADKLTHKLWAGSPSSSFVGSLRPNDVVLVVATERGEDGSRYVLLLTPRNELGWTWTFRVRPA